MTGVTRRRSVLRHYDRHRVVCHCNDVVHAKHSSQRFWRSAAGAALCQVHLFQASRSHSLPEDSPAPRAARQPSQYRVSALLIDY